MIRPAERFPVNIRPLESAPAARGPGWTFSMPIVLTAAVIVGAGIGGLIPGGRAMLQWQQQSYQMARGSGVDVTQIEPAAGPMALAGSERSPIIARAPDGAFYATAALDQVPVTLRLEPHRRDSSLLPRDAARLVPGGAAMTVRVSELALSGHVAGPVELAVGAADAPASVLGADLLADFTIVEIDRDHLRLVAR